MTQMFEITYIRTGSGEKKKIGQIAICTCDEKKNGEKANNIIGVIELFEEIMEDLGTYENKTGLSFVDAKRMLEEIDEDNFSYDQTMAEIAY